MLPFHCAMPHPRHLDIKPEKGFGDYTRRVYKLLGMEQAPLTLSLPGGERDS